MFESSESWMHTILVDFPVLKGPIDPFAGPDGMMYVTIVTIVSGVRRTSVPLLPEAQPDNFLISETRADDRFSFPLPNWNRR